MINAIGDVSRGTLFGYTPFKVKGEKFIAEAKAIVAKTDVEIFGPQEQYVEAVTKFVRGLRNDLLSASGTFLLNGYLERMFNTRRSVIEFIQSHREILQVSLFTFLFLFKERKTNREKCKLKRRLLSHR